MNRVELKVYESHKTNNTIHRFLMNRVELKVGNERASIQERVLLVPNEPCGVERRFDAAENSRIPLFLMNRVELKDSQVFCCEV